MVMQEFGLEGVMKLEQFVGELEWAYKNERRYILQPEDCLELSDHIRKMSDELRSLSVLAAIHGFGGYSLGGRKDMPLEGD